MNNVTFRRKRPRQNSKALILFFSFSYITPPPKVIVLREPISNELRINAMRGHPRSEHMSRVTSYKIILGRERTKQKRLEGLVEISFWGLRVPV